MICGIKLKSLVCLLALSLLLSSALYSEGVYLTEEEFQIVKTALEQAEKDLSEAQNEIQKLKSLQNDSQTTILRLDTLLTEQATELAMLKINSDLQLESYNRLKQRVDLIWMDRVGFSLVGFGAGYGTKAIVEQFK